MAVWYAYYSRKYKGGNPPYYDLNGIAWYDKLRADLPDIREKLLAFLEKDGVAVQAYFHKSRVEGTGWDVLPFVYWNARNERMIDKGNEVFAYFKDIPGMVSLSVNVLQPETRIKGHVGDTDAHYRVHIPIIIPAGLPDCGIAVSGINRPWVENDMVVFCDALYHEAWNMTDKQRIVMVMDVIKDEFLPQAAEISANILSSVLYQRFFIKYKFAKIFPTLLRNMIRTSVFRRKLLKKNIFEN